MPSDENSSDEIKEGSENQETVLHVATKNNRASIAKGAWRAREQASPTRGY